MKLGQREGGTGDEILNYDTNKWTSEKRKYKKTVYLKQKKHDGNVKTGGVMIPKDDSTFP